MNKTILTCKELKAEYIYAPHLKHSYIKVYHDSTIVIKTPHKDKSYARDFFHKKESWIRKQLHINASNQQVEINLENEVLIFGKIYTIDSSEAVYLRNRLHRLKNFDTKKILAAYDDFYKYMSSEYLPHRVEYFARSMKLEFAVLKFRKMKSRWGSCSSTKIITLNTQLIKIKKELIDYVIVHELAHLVHMNHSKEFHALVGHYLPQSKALRKRLKETHLSA